MSVDLTTPCADCGLPLEAHIREGRIVACRGSVSSPWMSATQAIVYLGDVEANADAVTVARALAALYQRVRRGLPATHFGRRLRFHRQHLDYFLEHGVDPRVAHQLRLARRRA